MARPANSKPRNDGDADVAALEPCASEPSASPDYRLEAQVGFLIRRAHQRATAIFNRQFAPSGLSSVQFAALVKVRDEGRVSQNQLGRLVHLDPVTIMGVINRLADRDLIQRTADAADKRRTLLSITATGLKLLEDMQPAGHQVSADTLEPLDEAERAQFLQLLGKLQ
jgi:DNA-binding MarR family transcriptional regulator